MGGKGSGGKRPRAGRRRTGDEIEPGQVVQIRVGRNMVHLEATHVLPEIVELRVTESDSPLMAPGDTLTIRHQADDSTATPRQAGAD